MKEAVHSKTNSAEATKNWTRKTAVRRYYESMTAEAILQKSVRYDRGGEPLEVVIPYGEFIDFIETYGLDLTEDERKPFMKPAPTARRDGRGISSSLRILRKNSASDAGHCFSSPRRAVFGSYAA